MVIENRNFDEERALYGESNILVRSCTFDGPADGESAFKECAEVTVEDCIFRLRYPFWHTRGLVARRIEMAETCRAPLWYSEHIVITDAVMNGPKALRECHDIQMKHCIVRSAEFGWSCSDVVLSDCSLEGEYAFLRGEGLHVRNLIFHGKYSFQYIENATFENCRFDTKDAFWHAKNVVVRNSTLKGEYLSWYSDGLTLDHCTIIGTQPLCYCKNLRLIDCEMIDTDLSFERSEVDATVTSRVDSVKNPRAGTIRLPEVGEIVMDDPMAKGVVEITAVRA